MTGLQSDLFLIKLTTWKKVTFWFLLAISQLLLTKKLLLNTDIHKEIEYDIV